MRKLRRGDRVRLNRGHTNHISGMMDKYIGDIVVVGLINNPGTSDEYIEYGGWSWFTDYGQFEIINFKEYYEAVQGL